MVDYMRAHLKLHKTAVKKELDSETMDHVKDIDDFKVAFDKVQKSGYNVTESLKVHVLKEHLLEWFALTGETMAKQYDGQHEAMYGNIRRGKILV